LKNKGLLNKTIVLTYGLENETDFAIYCYLLSKSLGFNKFAFANSDIFSTKTPVFSKYTFYNYFNYSLTSLVINNTGVWVLGKKVYFYDLNKSYNAQKLIVKTYNYSNFSVDNGILWFKGQISLGFKNPVPTNSNSFVSVKKITSLSNNNQDAYEIKVNLSFDYALVKIPIKISKVKYVKKCSVYDSSYHCLSGWKNLSFKIENNYLITNVTSFSVFVVGYGNENSNIDKDGKRIEASFFTIPELLRCLIEKLISLFS